MTKSPSMHIHKCILHIYRALFSKIISNLNNFIFAHTYIHILLVNLSFADSLVYSLVYFIILLATYTYAAYTYAN